MNEETENILQQITNERNITLSSKRLYWNAVEQYEQVQGLPLKELLEEAEKEEDQGIRWKHRRLRHHQPGRQRLQIRHRQELHKPSQNHLPLLRHRNPQPTKTQQKTSKLLRTHTL